MMFPVVVKGKIQRDHLCRYLEERGIETRYMMPVINQPFYQKIMGDLESSYPIAKRINGSGFYIGCHQGLHQEDLDRVVEVFAEYCQSAKELSRT